jgi:CheY-like chemotaxis protein
MARILAIEPDRERGVTLERLVGQHLGDADIVLTASAGDALVTLAEVPFDLILTSCLLTSADDEQLAAHLRAAPDLDHVPVLVVPPIVEPSRTCDVKAIVTGIEEVLAHSKHYAPDPEIDRPARLFLLEARRALLLEQGQPQRVDGDTMSLVRLGDELPATRDFAEWRIRARRWQSHELQWLSDIQLTWGARTRPRLHLRNMSSTGILVESDIEIILGQKTGFQLAGSDEETLIVHARVVRVELSDANSAGGTYVVAASFDRPFDSLGVVRSVRELRRSQGIV